MHEGLGGSYPASGQRMYLFGKGLHFLLGGDGEALEMFEQFERI